MTKTDRPRRRPLPTWEERGYQPRPLREGYQPTPPSTQPARSRSRESRYSNSQATGFKELVGGKVTEVPMQRSGGGTSGLLRQVRWNSRRFVWEAFPNVADGVETASKVASPNAAASVLGREGHPMP